MSRRWRTWLLATILLVATVVGAYALRSISGKAPEPPRIDESQVSPRISRVINEARAAVVKTPSSAFAWGRMAMVCTAHGYRAEALTCLMQAASLQPRQFRWPYFSGILLEEIDLLHAEERYAASIALENAYAPLRCRRGNVLLKLGKLEESTREFGSAVELEPHSPYPLLGLGRVELARGNYAAAQSQFEHAVQLAPWSREVHDELSRTYQRRGETIRAWEVLQQASRLPPSPLEMPDPEWQEALQREIGRTRPLALQADELVAQGDLESAIRVLRQLTIESPELSRPLLNLGQLLAARNDFAGAIGVYREVVERFPGESLAHYCLAVALESTNAADEAILHYRRASALKPDYVEARYRLGLMLRERGESAEAVDTLRRAVSADPGLAPAHLALALALRDLHDIDSALTHVRIAVRLAPDDPEPAKYLKGMLDTHDHEEN